MAKFSFDIEELQSKTEVVSTIGWPVVRFKILRRLNYALNPLGIIANWV